MSFVHLHTHSHYSLLDGLAKIDDLISEALALGMNSLALTDHGNMHGAVEFYKKSKKAGLKPIIGMEAYLAKRKLTDKQPNIDDKRYHLVLLAENNQGYKNLMKLATVASLEGFYYKPRIDKEILRKHSQGLIALSSCLSGEIPRALLNRDQKKARDLVLEYQEIFGRDSFFIELEHHPNIPNHQKIQKEFQEGNNKLFRNSLDSLLPQKLIPIIVRLSKIDPEKKVNLVTREERKSLLHFLKSFSLEVRGVMGFEKAMVTSGGISLNEVDPKTMRSKIIDNLFFAGEVLDLDGPTGGYNLQICWSTGHAAGEAAALN